MYAIVEIAGQQFKIEQAVRFMFTASMLKKGRKLSSTALCLLIMTVL